MRYVDAFFTPLFFITPLRHGRHYYYFMPQLIIAANADAAAAIILH